MPPVRRNDSKDQGFRPAYVFLPRPSEAAILTPERGRPDSWEARRSRGQAAVSNPLQELCAPLDEFCNSSNEEGAKPA
jgi:hypothetical protein